MKLFIGQDLKYTYKLWDYGFFMISKFGSTLLNLTKPILEKFLIAELLWYTLYNSKVWSLNNFVFLFLNLKIEYMFNRLS